MLLYRYNIKVILFLLVLFGLLNFSELRAQDQYYLSYSLAKFDVLKEDRVSLEGRIELHRDKLEWKIDPFIGLMSNTDGASYLYAGAKYDIFVWDYFVVTPSFAPGIYSTGQSKNLNFFLEFRSQLEVSYLFSNKSRLGVSFNHISNASLGKRNPGVESISVSFSHPL